MSDQPKTKELGTLDAVEDGSAVDVSHMYKYDKYVTVAGTFVGTVQIQASNDGTNWVQDGANITTPKAQAVTSRSKYLRAICSAYTSGEMECSVYGIQTTPEV